MDAEQQITTENQYTKEQIAEAKKTISERIVDEYGFIKIQYYFDNVFYIIKNFTNFVIMSFFHKNKQVNG